MLEPNASDALPLAGALIQWCEQSLVEAVRVQERMRPDYELQEFYSYSPHRLQLIGDGESRRPAPTDWMAGGQQIEALVAAWRKLESNFRHRLADGIYLTGVQTRPTLLTERQPIPSAWAADGTFDFMSSALEVNGVRFAAVVASLAPSALEATRATAPADPVAMIAPDNVRALSDDQVLLLLEEHARRVVEGPDAKLIAPGKISLMPIIRRKMLLRAELGELLQTVGAEARELRLWIKTKISSHQVPTDKVIENNIREDYGRLKLRSTGIKP